MEVGERWVGDRTQRRVQEAGSGELAKKIVAHMRAPENYKGQ